MVPHVIPYDVPPIPALLTVSSFLYLIIAAESLFSKLLNAGLIGPLIIGIVASNEAVHLLSEQIQATFTTLGYIGLLLIVFEAGLFTNISLLFQNIVLSAVSALTGICFPIAGSLLLLHFGYGYTPLQSFAAGAALCSTSLGTTLALLSPALRETRVGAVLMSAALLDDIAGLVMAAIISQLAISSSTSAIPWPVIVRPILVSFGFTFLVPLFAYLFGKLHLPMQVFTLRVQLFLIVATLSGFVAGSKYAGTSELYGAYLAGAFLGHVLACSSHESPHNVTARTAFQHYLAAPLQLLSPIFFASIGAAIPIRSLGTPRVVWRGIIYSVCMIVSKMIVGLWMLIWKDDATDTGWFGRKSVIPKPSACQIHCEMETEAAAVQEPTLTRLRGAVFLGSAMVARGEIALIVAQLARPLLVQDSDSQTSEEFAVVIWAILVATIVGAIGVGFVLRGAHTPHKHK